MIRKALPTDINSIYKIYKQNVLNISRINDLLYLTEIQKNGFIVDVETKESILTKIKKAFIFNVYEIDNQIVGFIVIDYQKYFPENASNIIWLNKKEKHNYFHSEKSTVLHIIAIDNIHRQQGIATELLNQSLLQAKSKYNQIYSIIALNPSDIPSLLFHTKNKFTRVCVTMPRNMLGIKNYQSLLFVRKI